MPHSPALRRGARAHHVEIAGVELLEAFGRVEEEPAAVEPAEQAFDIALRQFHPNARADPMRTRAPGCKMLLRCSRSLGPIGKAPRELVREEREKPLGRGVGREFASIVA